MLSRPGRSSTIFGVAVACALLTASCATVTQAHRSECTLYQEKVVPVTSCAKMAPQTCTTSGGYRSCYGGGYCEAYVTKSELQRQCVATVCKPGYVKTADGCFTEQELAKARPPKT